MSVKELTREQLIELKIRFYMENGGGVSWEELANIDELVSDEEVFNEYDGITFYDADFLIRNL